MTPEERIEKIENLMAKAVENQLVLQNSVIELTQTVSRCVDAADARMKRIETNLDALIMAITAEHKNGGQ
jgi:hypothetical protein